MIGAEELLVIMVALGMLVWLGADASWLLPPSGGPTVSGAGLPPCFTVTGFGGMAIDSQVLEDGVVLLDDPDYYS